MPEPPDFDTIARALVASFAPEADPFVEDARVPIARALRQAWNGRGEADLILMETYLSSVLGVSGAGPHVKNLERAVKAIDR